MLQELCPEHSQGSSLERRTAEDEFGRNVRYFVSRTALQSLPAALAVAVFVAFLAGAGSVAKTILVALLAGSIFYLLYSFLDKNPAAEDEDSEDDSARSI